MIPDEAEHERAPRHLYGSVRYTRFWHSRWRDWAMRLPRECSMRAPSCQKGSGQSNKLTRRYVYHLLRCGLPDEIGGSIIKALVMSLRYLPPSSPAASGH